VVRPQFSTKRFDKPGVQYRKLSNHPAENVSWYDAVAFCRWLTKCLDYEIRLPTEWEWQQAATGGDPNNMYPWGTDWNSDRANTYECGLSRTTAVGLYPQGCSPVGILDMSGNVREWCLNDYGNPKRIELSAERRRTVCGGSWYLNQELARCGCRRFAVPEARYGYIGFRLFCMSPIFRNTVH